MNLKFLSSRYLRLEFLIYVPLICVSLVIAISESRSAYRFDDLLYLSSALTPEDSANALVIHKYALEAEGVVNTNECRSDIVQAGLSFVMRDLDLQDATNRYEDWSDAMNRATLYVIHGLSCNPADGDMWVRLALISQSVGENPQQLSALMNQSVLLSPAEMHTIRARFVVWKKATGTTLSMSADSVRHDIRMLLSYGQSWDIVSILGTANKDHSFYTLIDTNSNLNAYINAAETLLPVARRRFLGIGGIHLQTAPAP